MDENVSREKFAGLVNGIISGMEEVLGVKAISAIIHYGAVKYGTELANKGKFTKMSDYLENVKELLLSPFDFKTVRENHTIECRIKTEDFSVAKTSSTTICKGLVEGGFRAIAECSPSITEEEKDGYHVTVFTK
ncbi:MAG: hypothetical protein CVT48_02195 [Thermoplasmata archaeon HGW-Thermoplasmata-1]|nr:MAG: hypothetical protein CVT48_02195 [Thermoplasmata archaeon HGW-Thermoplasmata-1]